MDKLAQARSEIDEIDACMAQLFEKRMQTVKNVAEYKRANNMPVLDEKREEAVIQNNKKRLQNKELEDLFEGFLRENMALSRAYQKRILASDTVAYQGVEGAYSHIALKKLFPFAAAKSYSSFAEVFESVENGDAENGVLPLENSFAGDVSEVLDLCFAHGLHVQAVYDLPIEHCLLGVEGAKLSDIKEVYSHPQALSQCNDFIKAHKLNVLQSANTAIAAKSVASEKDVSKAAIASKATARLYGLEVIASAINTSSANTTRFIVIGKRLLNEGNRFSLLFTVAHTAGSLAKVIQTIGERGFNLECIKSRPMPNAPWEYYFYTEIVGDANEQSTKELLKSLDVICNSTRLLGVYHK